MTLTTAIATLREFHPTAPHGVGYRALQVVLNALEWRPIATAPRNGTRIELRGPSGYTSTPYRIEVGYFDPALHSFWCDYTGEAWACAGDGGEPTHWRPHYVD